MQFELFPIAEYSPVTQDQTLNHWDFLPTSTRTKRPIKRDRPGQGKRSQPQIIHTI